jgi:hypothetical protein
MDFDQSGDKLIVQVAIGRLGEDRNEQFANVSLSRNVGCVHTEGNATDHQTIRNEQIKVLKD